MANFPVINTSPLIFITKSNWLELLQQIFDSTIIVPQAVAVEIQAYGEQDITFQALISTD
ncbi:MAG: hypothetical protein WBA93_18830 [Microcoleaceae cyanobacterium]